MNAADIAAIVSSVGFPILACIYLAKYFKTIMEQHRQELKEQQERHDLTNSICQGPISKQGHS